MFYKPSTKLKVKYLLFVERQCINNLLKINYYYLEAVLVELVYDGLKLRSKSVTSVI